MQSRRNSTMFARFFNPEVPLLFVIGSAVLAVVGSGVYDLLTRFFGDSTPVLLLMTGGAAVGLYGYVAVVQAILRARLHAREANEVLQDIQVEPRAGLILLLSSSKEASDAPAIDFHLRNSTLRACWLITTPEAQTKATSLLHALNERNVEVTPLPLADAFHARKAYEVVSTALELATRQLGRSAVIVDITGGTKPMTAGAVLACREQGVAMQYMRSEYVNGRRVSEAKPRAMEVEVA